MLQVFGLQAHIRGRRRRRSQRCQCRGIQSRYASYVFKIDELRQIAIFNAILGAHILMLMVEILAPLGKAYRRESLLVE